MSNNDKTTQFTGKYEKSGSIGQRLVNNFFETLLALIPREGRSILEVGCGAGYSTERIAEAFPEAHIEASDVEQELVDMTKERIPQVPAKVESIYKLDRDDNSFDTVLALEVFEHLEDPVAALAEIHRVTARFAIISVPREPLWRVLNMLRGKYWSGAGNTPGHLNHWSVSSFQKFVSTKFKVRVVKTPLPWIMLLLEKRHD